MARMTKEEIHQQARREFDAVWSACREERDQCIEDRRFCFIPGAQWEESRSTGNLCAQYENKPKMESNVTNLSVMGINNEYRNNRISVTFLPKGGAGDDDLAETMNGLYRADEQDSCAEEAYDNAFEEASAGGFGAWRLRADYEDEESEDDGRQRIYIEPIFDADQTVFFDLGAIRRDKSDASRCWALIPMTRDAYKEKYEEDPVAWPSSVGAGGFDWYDSSSQTVYLAEYFRVEEGKDKILVYRGLLDDEVKKRASEITDEDKQRLEATGYRVVREKTVKRRRVKRWLMSGSKILEDGEYIAGKHIPIIPVYGKRRYVDGMERMQGHVRLAKDPQRLKNMQLSKLAEIASLSAVEKPILAPKQIEGFRTMWQEDNIRNNAYLLLNPMKDENGNAMTVGPMAYTKPPVLPEAMTALLEVTNQDLTDILGGSKQDEAASGPNASGYALEQIHNRLDMQTFNYISNMAVAIKRCGEVWREMAREIFVEEGREMKIVAPDGKQSSVKLLTPKADPETGETIMENDLSRATFRVSVDVGPSSASRRMATVRALLDILAVTTDPEAQQIIINMILMNLEGEGMEDMRSYFRAKLIRMGAVKPNEEERKELEAEAANAQPDPNAEYLQAEAAKARMDTVLTGAKAERERAETDNTKVETMKTLSEIGLPHEEVRIKKEQALKKVATQKGNG